MILGRSELLRRLNDNPPLVEGLIDPEIQVQPAGIELTLRKVYRICGAGSIDFDNSGRIIPKYEELKFNGEWIHLGRGIYIVQYNEVVNMPLDLVAIARPRSSLVRCGATVETAVWDPGYRGRSYSLLIVYNEEGIRLKRNARLVQLVFIKVMGDTGGGYKGTYQFEGLKH